MRNALGVARALAFIFVGASASVGLFSCGRSDPGLYLIPYESGGSAGLASASGGSGASTGATGGSGAVGASGGSGPGMGGRGPASGGGAGRGVGGAAGVASVAGAGGVMSVAGRAGAGTAGGGMSGTAGAAGGATSPPFQLLGVPLTFAPTTHGFGLNVVLSAGDPQALVTYLRMEGDTDWQPVNVNPTFPASDTAQWQLEGLLAASRYEYLVAARDADGETNLYLGSVITTRAPGTSFTAALITDSHIQPREVPPGDVSTTGSMEPTLALVARDVEAAHPDFVLNLGDILDFHPFGFNDPPPNASWARLGYLNYRRLLSTSIGNAAHFGVIGNWDGESGCNTLEEIERSRSQRLIYEPNPGPETYPEGGSPNQDYYAFTWGDALFVVLNVMTYTPTCHLLNREPGLPDDWTLGSAQLDWLRSTLQNATSKWRFTFIHHTVGGKAGDDTNSAYGRGGGQAAYVGEQAIVHQMLLDYGVQIFFYAHDHVFTDMTVDGVHYTLPGSAGAPWHFDTSETGYADYFPVSGFAKLDVSPDSVNVAFVEQGGAVIQQITLP